MAQFLFDCLENDFEDAERHKHAAVGPGAQARLRGGLGLRQLLLYGGSAPPALLSLSVSAPFQQAQTADDAQTAPDQQHKLVLQALVTSLNRFEQFNGASQLLQLVRQPTSNLARRQPALQATFFSSLPCSAALPGWLALCKKGSTLQLVSVHHDQPLQQPEVHAVAEFQHDSFKHLGVQQCWLAPGPLLLLQPEPGQLLLIAPAAAAAHSTGHERDPGNTAASDNWQLIELDLPARQLLQQIHPDDLAWWLSCATGTAEAPAAGGQLQLMQHAARLATGTQQCYSSLFSSTNPRAAAAGPIQVLHMSQAPKGCSHTTIALQLLVSLTVAAQGAAHGQARQQALLFWLSIPLDSTQQSMPGAAASSPREQQPGVVVMCCYATGWQQVPTCVAVTDCCGGGGCNVGQQRPIHQRIALGSSTGAVQLLQLGTSCQQQQQQQQSNTMQSSNSMWECVLQAQAELLGQIDNIVHLPQVHAAGTVCKDVLAVIHSSSSSSGSGSRSGTGSRDNSSGACSTASLLVQQGMQLQVVARIHGVAALLAPGDGFSTSAGLLCPWQQQQQQQQNLAACFTGEEAYCSLSIGAVVLLHPQPAASNAQEGSMTGMNSSYAYLPAGAAAEVWPGSMLCLLKEPPQRQQYTSESRAAAVKGQRTADMLDAGQAVAASSNELRGICAMLRALERRWQQETSDICLLQSRLSQAQHVVVAAHSQLCQLAADTLQSSTARQYTMPLTQVSNPAAAVAAYQIGKQIAQQLNDVQHKLLQSMQQHQRQQADTWTHGQQQQQDLRLVLQLISSSVQVQGEQLQLQVCAKPQLQLQQHAGHKQTQGTFATQPQQQQEQQEQEQQQQQQHECSTAADSSSVSGLGFWGPLLRLCHAEVVLWHADVSPITSQCSWQWDASTGHLTAQAAVPASALLPLALARHASNCTDSSTNSYRSSSCSIMGGKLQDLAHLDNSAAAACTAGEDAYISAARAIAAAAAAAGNSMGRSNCGTSRQLTSSNGGCAVSSRIAVELHAAVVASACCSNQAVAQLLAEQLEVKASGEAHQAAAAAAPADDTAKSLMLRAQLLAPATALLHLPNVRVPAEALLHGQGMTNLALPTAPHHTQHKQQQQEQGIGTYDQAAAGVAMPSHFMQTPPRAAMPQQQQLGSTAAASPPPPQQSALQYSVGQLTNDAGADVVPPTPYSTVQGYDMMQRQDDIDSIHELMQQQQQSQHDIVIKDSQEEAEDDDAIAPDTMRGGADKPPVAAATIAAAAGEGRAATNPAAAMQEAEGHLQQQEQHKKELLLQCHQQSSGSSALQLLPAGLLHLGFTLASNWGGQRQFEAELQQLDAQAVQQQLQQQDQLEQGHRLVQLLLQLPGQRGTSAAAGPSSSSGSSSSSVRLVWFSSKAVHVVLTGSSMRGVEVAQQLLLLAVSSLPGGAQGITCQASPLSAAAAARCLAATDTLSQAVALQCKVVEETLQQLHHSTPVKASTDAAGAQVAGVAAVTGAAGEKRSQLARNSAGTTVPMKRPAGVMMDEPQQQQLQQQQRATVFPAAAGAVGGSVVVDGQPVGKELAACWLAVYQAMADVDLAIAQLEALH